MNVVEPSAFICPDAVPIINPPGAPYSVIVVVALLFGYDTPFKTAESVIL